MTRRRKKRRHQKSVSAGEIGRLWREYLNAPTEDAGNAAFARCLDLIDVALKRGLDGVLEDALADCESPDEWLSLQRTIAGEAETTDILLQGTDGDYSPGEALLFAIPLILGSHGEFIDTLSDDQLDKTVKSIRKHGLIDALPTVMLFPGVYSSDEMPTEFSEIRACLSQAVNRLGSGRAPIKRQVHAERFDPRYHTLRLRYLVGVMMAGDVDFMFMEEDEGREQRLETWQSYVRDTLTQGGQDRDMIQVCEPLPYDEAVSIGILAYNGITLSAMLSQTMTQLGLAGNDCALAIEADLDNGMLFVSLLDPAGKRVDTQPLVVRYLLGDFMEHLADQIVGSASDLGITNIHWSDEMLSPVADSGPLPGRYH